MNETYCGKSCDACDYKISGKCPGCNEGPGHREFGACDLAKCCRDKGYKVCESCRFHYDCYLVRDKEFMPEEMAKKTKNELDRRDKMSKIAPVLAIWINILLWINLPSFIGGLLNNQEVAKVSPPLSLLGVLLILGSQLAYGLILMKIALADKRYKLAGIFLLISLAVTILVLFIPANAAVLIQAVNLVATVISVVSIYYEIMAHAEVLRGIDNLLGRKWLALWKWTLISLALSLASGFVMLAVANLAALMVLATAIISLVVTVLKIKYLYDTAKVFKNINVDINDNVNTEE